MQINALYDADADPVAPHGLIGQSYDGDNVGVDGEQDVYKVRAAARPPSVTLRSRFAE